MHDRSGLPIQREFHGLAREIDGEIVAAFGYDSFQDWSCQLHACTDLPSGFNRTLLRAAFDVPYNQWGYRCLIGIIQHGNSKSLKFARKLGFKEFGLLSDAHPSGGLHVLVQRREDCRWL